MKNHFVKKNHVIASLFNAGVVIFTSVFFCACGGDSSNNSGTGAETAASEDIHFEENDPSSYKPENIVPIKNKTITGKAQKGPFKSGSTVDVFELELDGKTFAQTGKSFMGKVSNDSGAFKISNVSLKSQYALLRVTGNFKSEINGESVHATLTAVTDLSKRENVNVNILTHLEYDRVLYLLGKGMNFTAAKKQAEREVLAAFGIEGNFKNSEDMNVFGNSDADAALVAISKLLLAGNKEGTNRDEESLMDLLSQVSLSLEEDGEWDNIGGRNNSPGDYVPWENKANIGLRLDTFYNEKGNCNFKVAGSVVEKYIRHFIFSWNTVGQYCTSALDGKVVDAWSTYYRDKYLCKDGEWRYVGKGSDGDYVVDSLNSTWKYIGTDIEWCKEYLEIEVKGWSKGKDGEIKKGSKTGTNYKYDEKKGLWRVITDLDTLLSVCTIKHNGEITKDKESYYYCDKDGWRNATDYEKDTYKWAKGKDGEIKKGRETGKVYKFDEKYIGCQDSYYSSYEKRECVDEIGWRIVSSLDTLLSVCTIKHNGEIQKGKDEKSLYYYCDNGNWREATKYEVGVSNNKCTKDGSLVKFSDEKIYKCSNDKFVYADFLDSALGLACVSYLEGKSFERNNDIYSYTCEKGSWRKNWANENCTKDGKVAEMFYDLSDDKKKFVCDADTFRVATKIDSLYGFACVSYTDGKTIKRQYDIHSYTCKKGLWEIGWMKENCTKDGKIAQMFYDASNDKKDFVCDADTFRVAMAADSLYNLACVSYLEGKSFERNGDIYSYTCEKGSWKKNWSAKNCTKDGKIVQMFYDASDDKKDFVCDADTFRVATTIDSLYDFACVSYTDGKSAERQNAIYTYKCEKNVWKINDAWSKSNCIKDGSIQTLICDETGKTNDFVCDADTFRVASTEILHGIGCVSYTDGKMNNPKTHTCSNGEWVWNGTYETFKDSRDGKIYKAVIIGSQKWMAENLNYDTTGYCYASDCTKYGRLYAWNPALSICPKGWHLPSINDWRMLITAVGGSLVATTKLKSTSGWDKYGDGTDDFGFSALPAGFYSGGFWGGGYQASFWSSSKTGTMSRGYDVYCVNLSDGSCNPRKCPEGDYSFGYEYHSVRCVQNGVYN